MKITEKKKNIYKIIIYKYNYYFVYTYFNKKKKLTELIEI